MLASDIPFTETQGWWLIVAVGVLAAIALINAVVGRRP